MSISITRTDDPTYINTHEPMQHIHTKRKRKDEGQVADSYFGKRMMKRKEKKRLAIYSVQA